MSNQTFAYVSSCEPHPVSLSPGQYLFELWGASGGKTDSEGGYGYGAYVSAVLKLRTRTNFYIYIGGRGGDGNKTSISPDTSCNGGGAGGRSFNVTQYVNGAAGGGATDVRLNNNLSSRILVAAGGGGAGHRYEGGDAGALESSDAIGHRECSKGANQTYGYSKGVGQNGRDAGGYYGNGAEGNGGGGGGYYGGFSYQLQGQGTDAPGAGGSSFISGYHDNNYVSGFSFINPVMIGGGNMMKAASINISYEIGHIGDGFAIITNIGNLYSQYVTHNSIYKKLRVILFN
jgi:hypothetical protein